MPRLDNTNPKVVEYYDLSFDEDDPGDTPLVDLCAYCFALWQLYVDIEIAHPDYEDWNDYRCIQCDKRLTAEDN